MKHPVMDVLRKWGDWELGHQSPQTGAWLHGLSMSATDPDSVDDPTVATMWQTGEALVSIETMSNLRILCLPGGSVLVCSDSRTPGHNMRQVGAIDMETGEWLEQLDLYHVFDGWPT